MGWRISCADGRFVPHVQFHTLRRLSIGMHCAPTDNHVKEELIMRDLSQPYGIDGTPGDEPVPDAGVSGGCKCSGAWFAYIFYTDSAHA